MEKKNTYNKKMKEYERQKQKEMDDIKEMHAVEKEAEKERFEEQEKNILTKHPEGKAEGAGGSSSGSVSNMEGGCQIYSRIYNSMKSFTFRNSKSYFC